MRYLFTERFVEQLESFSVLVQKKFWKQLKFLLHDIHHPSLQTKKIEENIYVLLDIKKHPK